MDARHVLSAPWGGPLAAAAHQGSAARKTRRQPRRGPSGSWSFSVCCSLVRCHGGGPPGHCARRMLARTLRALAHARPPATRSDRHVVVVACSPGVQGAADGTWQAERRRRRPQLHLAGGALGRGRPASRPPARRGRRGHGGAAPARAPRAGSALQDPQAVAAPAASRQQGLRRRRRRAAQRRRRQAAALQQGAPAAPPKRVAPPPRSSPPILTRALRLCGVSMPRVAMNG